MRLLLLASLCLLEGSSSTHFLLETVDASADPDDTEDFSNGPEDFSGSDETVVKESGADYGEDAKEEEEHKTVATDDRIQKDLIDMGASILPHHSKYKSISISDT